MTSLPKWKHIIECPVETHFFDVGLVLDVWRLLIGREGSRLAPKQNFTCTKSVFTHNITRKNYFSEIAFNLIPDIRMTEFFHIFFRRRSSTQLHHHLKTIILTSLLLDSIFFQTLFLLLLLDCRLCQGLTLSVGIGRLLSDCLPHHHDLGNFDLRMTASPFSSPHCELLHLEG